jgi:hypothetical protein
MAEVVLGLAASHGPPVTMPATQWHMLREKDQKDKRMDYSALLAAASPRIADECTEEKMQARYDAAQRALGKLHDVLRETKPDVLVVVGDDQNEQFGLDQMPTFCIYRGATMEMKKKAAGGGASKMPGSGQWGNMAWQQASRDPNEESGKVFPAAPGLAEHVISSLMDQEFDVSVSGEIRADVGLGHAFTFVYRTIMPEGDIPLVPVNVNTGYPPNQPGPKRCLAFGRALRKAVESWDSGKRVAIMASGGLSHVIIDEELDRQVIDALLEDNPDDLVSIPIDRLNRAAGTMEIRNWIAVGAALQGLSMTMESYEPCYRSPAGTGVGMGFAYWK